MDVYAELPSAKNASKKKEKRKGTVHDTLTDLLPIDGIPSKDIEELKHKVQALDSVHKKWAETKSFPPSRNLLSARDRRKHKLFDIPKEGHKFENYMPLHNLWKAYMRNILDIKRFASSNTGMKKENNERLLKADYHGCFIVVAKSKCPSMLAVSGIVLMETKNIFKIISKDNKIKCLPKENNVFSFELDGFLFTIHGNHFCINPNQRSRRKFKQKATLDLI